MTFICFWIKKKTFIFGYISYRQLSNQTNEGKKQYEIPNIKNTIYLLLDKKKIPYVFNIYPLIVVSQG